MADHMKHSLINPNQLRAFGTVIQDNPYAGEPMVLHDPDDTIRIPLKMKGSNVVLDTRTPTQSELTTCTHVLLSSPSPWNPDELQVPEINALASHASLTSPESPKRYFISSVRGEDYVNMDAFEDIFDLDGINRRLISSVRVADIPKKRGRRHSKETRKGGTYRRSRATGSSCSKDFCF
jgi:hypothetical protein